MHDLSRGFLLRKSDGVPTSENGSVASLVRTMWELVKEELLVKLLSSIETHSNEYQLTSKSTKFQYFSGITK